MADILNEAEIRFGITALVAHCHGTAREKGWHDDAHPTSFGDRIALIHSEVSEALEEFRAGHGFDETYYLHNGHPYDTPPVPGAEKPEGIPPELADIIIRVADLAGLYGVPLADAVVEKMAYNQTRPHRHGGKVI